MNLRYTPQAIADIQGIKGYIRDVLHTPVAAGRIAHFILGSCAALKKFPEMGVSLSAKTGFETDLRMLVCGQYIALYRIDREVDTVSVARILHAQQDYIRILLGETGPAEQEETSE